MFEERPVVLFDGVCNFCNATINFIIRQDKQKALRFAALQSEAGQELLAQYGLQGEALNTFVFIENGKAYGRSTAALHLYKKLPWYWQWTQAFWIVPKFIRNGVYNFIAKKRYQWFGKKEECMVPSPEAKSRFL